ncbi:MAG: serine--tRNA ligase [Candidatus Nanoarchaeia archaeon]|nr:serine--tRNA ligase [Candidatus Jingweiarchaeum tengchongense]
MLDIKLIREKPEIVKDDLIKRGMKDRVQLVDELLEIDKKWREGVKKVGELRHKRNIISRQVAELKKKGKDVSKEIKEIEEIPMQIKKIEMEIEKYKNRINEILYKLPNILHESVPIGKDENDNVEIRRWGTIPKFNFKPKNHLEIALGLGIIDQERAAKVAGKGFYYFKNELVLLDYAIIRFAIDFLMKRGYILIEPPFMIRRKPYEGVVDLADFENVMYKIEKEDLYLIATAEHPLAAMFMNETINAKELPIKLVGVSPCFRKEVGAHGKYTKGLFRMHQFNKVEQFIFCHPNDSWKLHEELQKNSEDLYKALKLPYRVVNVCSGDIGTIAAKKYDIEVWMVDGKYREVGSNSNCTDYQARRLNIKYREKEGLPPAGYVHTLNNTALATSRTMMAILEIYQQEDGSVKIPDVLVPYMNGIKVIKAK